MGLFASAAPAVAQDFSLVTTLVHPNTRPNNEDRFGSGLAISGGTLFVGAKGEKAANDYSGVVHVFSDTDWSEVAQLKSSVDADYGFGASIQLDGDRALISNASIDYGLVWFFEKDQGVWTEKLRLKGLLDEAFGYRLALRGDLAFVAASRIGTGSVHVYRRVAGMWSEAQVLTASDAQDGDFFGFAIAFDGQRLAISAPGNMLGPERSSVYTFSKMGDAFVEDGKLSGDPATQWFGADVGVNGDTLIVNAPPAYQVTSVGKALVYQRQGDRWTLDSELTVDGEASFPAGVALDGDTAWFGARTSDPSSQSVYAFQRANGAWHQGQKLNFPTPGQYEIASWIVKDGTLAVGFWNGLSTNSVQVYRAPGHQSSSGGAPNGGSGGGATGPEAAGADDGGTSGNDTPTAAGSNHSTPSGGGSAGSSGAQPSNPGGATSNGGASAGSSPTNQPGNNADQASGCSCRTVGSRGAAHDPLPASLLVLSVVTLSSLRRPRKRSRTRAAN